MENIKTQETKLIGKWLFENGKVIEDETSKRINYLKNNYLQKIAISPSGWETLYQDPSDERYWELKYFESELSGGGPPSLIHISKEEATRNFSF